MDQQTTSTLLLEGKQVVRSSRRAGFTVASLLLLTAIVAVYAAAIMTARDMDPAPQPEELAAFAIAGFFFGTVTGFFLGLFCGNRNRDMIFGVVEGGLFGPPTFVLLVIPDSLPVVLVGGDGPGRIRGGRSASRAAYGPRS